MTFENQNHQNRPHPEFFEAGLGAQTPGQFTLGALIHAINEKVRFGREYGDGSVGTELRHHSQELAAYRIRKGASLDDPIRVGRLCFGRRLGGEAGRIVTNYFITHNSGDLHIHKHERMDIGARTIPSHSIDASPNSSAMADLAAIAEVQKARSEEAMLGLNFVSEHEVRGVLSLIKNAEPIF